MNTNCTRANIKQIYTKAYVKVVICNILKTIK